MTKAPSLTGFAPDNLRGIAWLMASVISASIMALGVRELSGAIDSRAIVFYRALITSLALLIWFAFSSRERAALRFSQPSLHILRSLAIAISTHLGFYAITQMPLVTVSVLFFTAPIFATLLSIFVHKERPGIRRWSAILLGFAGVIVVLRPGVEPLDWPTIAALLSSLLFALALVVSRKLAQADGPISVLLSATIVTLIVSTPLAWSVFSVPAEIWPLGVLAAVILAGALRGLADIQAYRWGEASVLAPFAYTRLLFIGAGAYVFFGEVPEMRALIGAAIIVAAALYIAQRERRAKT